MNVIVEKTCRCGAMFEFEDPYSGERFSLGALRALCDACQVAEERDRRDREAAGDAAHRKLRFDRRLSRSGLPRALRHLAFDEPASGEPRSLRSAREWAARERDGLVLLGPVGTGKTHMAACAAWQRLHHENVLWASVPSIIARSFNDGDRADVARVLTDGKTTLVLDDLDKVKASEWVASQLFSAIDSRVAEGSGLLITLNLKPSELGDKLGDQFGEAIVSRLAGYCRIATVGDRDRRINP